MFFCLNRMRFWFAHAHFSLPYPHVTHYSAKKMPPWPLTSKRIWIYLDTQYMDNFT